MNLAMACLMRVQHEDGTIDLHSTNFHSTPDTAFLVNYLSPVYVVLKRMDQKGLSDLIKGLEQFLPIAFGYADAGIFNGEVKPDIR